MHKRVDMPKELKIQTTGVSLPTRKGQILKFDNINLRGCLYPRTCGMAEALKTGLFGFTTNMEKIFVREITTVVQ